MEDKAVYIRTSTIEQNPENQLEDIKSLFEGEFELFRDQQSAWKEEKERPDFEKLNKEIKRGKIKSLYVWDLDRIYRDRKKLLGFFEFCKLNNCKIFSFRQKWLSDFQNIKLPAGFEWIAEMQLNNFLNFLGWIAEEESSKKSERVKNAVRKEPGKRARSYKGNPWGRKKLNINKNVLSKIKELRDSSQSIRAIARDPEVYYYDKQRHRKNLSIATIHEILKAA